MQIVSATYQGKTTKEIIKGKTYIIQVNKNSMMVCVGKLKLPYKNIYDFLNDWSNIILGI